MSNFLWEKQTANGFNTPLIRPPEKYIKYRLSVLRVFVFACLPLLEAQVQGQGMALIL